LKISPKKIDVVFQGSHPIFKQSVDRDEREQILALYKIPSEYILNVGTIEERKNAALIVEALSIIPQSLRLPLVIVGRSTTYKDTIIKLAQQLKVDEHLIFVHDAKFQHLPAIYQGAKVFVYPSLFEGFGIPLIEAIESNVPVITSKESCFSEAAGPDSFYIDSSNAEELAAQLQRVLTDTTLSKQMTTHSTEYIRKFQPDIIAKDVHTVYERLLKQ
jgi:glycosyltransferase involved in cell wall biosynthesis